MLLHFKQDTLRLNILATQKEKKKQTKQQNMTSFFLVHLSLAPLNLKSIISSHNKVTCQYKLARYPCQLSYFSQLIFGESIDVREYTVQSNSILYVNTQTAGWMQVRLPQWYCMQRWKGEGIGVSCSSGTMPR